MMIIMMTIIVIMIIRLIIMIAWLLNMMTHVRRPLTTGIAGSINVMHSESVECRA